MRDKVLDNITSADVELITAADATQALLTDTLGWSVDAPVSLQDMDAILERVRDQQAVHQDSLNTDNPLGKAPIAEAKAHQVFVAELKVVEARLLLIRSLLDEELQVSHCKRRVSTKQSVLADCSDDIERYDDVADAERELAELKQK